MVWAASTFLALVLVGATAPSLANASTPGGDIALCERSFVEMRSALNTEPKMRDEAYTAIMLAELAAEEAREARDVEGCLDALDVARLVLGLPPSVRR